MLIQNNDVSLHCLNFIDIKIEFLSKRFGRIIIHYDCV